MSSDVVFKIGVTHAHFWLDGKTPFWIDELNNVVMNGASSSTYCFTIQVGTGSNMEFLFAAFWINRTTTVSSTVEKVSKFTVHPPTSNIGRCALDVDERTPATLSVKAWLKFSALIRFELDIVDISFFLQRIEFRTFQSFFGLPQALVPQWVLRPFWAHERSKPGARYARRCFSESCLSESCLTEAPCGITITRPTGGYVGHVVDRRLCGSRPLARGRGQADRLGNKQ